MNRVVIDCSVTMAWCFDDEASRYTDAVLHALSANEALVPGLWSLEVANVLTLAERANRITVAKTTTFLRLLQDLPIHIDQQTAHRAFDGILNLARAHRLTAYDAAYLELAIREAAPVATQDRALRLAADELGVTVFEG